MHSVDFKKRDEYTHNHRPNNKPNKSKGRDTAERREEDNKRVKRCPPALHEDWPENIVDGTDSNHAPRTNAERGHVLACCGKVDSKGHENKESWTDAGNKRRKRRNEAKEDCALDAKER